MLEMIDRETLLHELCGMCCAGDKYKCRNPWGECDEVTLIKKQPTIKPEVQHGRWIVHTTWHGMFGLVHSECSECKFDRNGDLSSWKFCPRCGARMDGEVQTDARTD